MKKAVIAFLVIAGLIAAYLYSDSYIVLEGQAAFEKEKENHRIRIDAQYGAFNTTISLDRAFPLELSRAVISDGTHTFKAVSRGDESRKELERFDYDIVRLSLFPDINGNKEFPAYEDFEAGNYTLELTYSVNEKEFNETHTVRFDRKRRLNLPSVFLGF